MMTMTHTFQPYGKTPRLFRDVVITEKLNGTNAAVVIRPMVEGETFADHPQAVAFVDDTVALFAQSRNRIIEVGADNMGFASWVQRNATTLVEALGYGAHFGEWWGKGIQGDPHDAGTKVFSVFNTHKFGHLYAEPVELTDGTLIASVPVLYQGVMSEAAVRTCLDALTLGSVAWPGTDPREPQGKAEGVVVYHSQSKQVYKVLLESDHLSKTERDR